MPQVAAWAAAAVVSAMGVTGTTAALVSAVVQTAVYAGISTIAGAITAPKVAAAEGRPTEWTADPDAPIPFVLGRRGYAGQIVHRDTYGPDARYEGIVTVYSGGGPINAFGGFILDGVPKTFTGELMNGTPVNRLWRQTRLGAQPDTALTSPSVAGGHVMAGWGANHKLSGKACTMTTLRQDGDFEYWPTGEPKTLEVIQGLLSWDPRLDSTWPGGSGSCRLNNPATWVYSRNGAILALKWALGIRENGFLVGGIGSSVDGIDVASFITAANVADTNSWTCSAVAYSDAVGGDDKYQVLEALLQTACAVPSSYAGKISCISRAAAPASIGTFSAADTAGPFEITGGALRSGRINTLIPKIVSEADNWEMVPLAPIIGSTYVAEDGGATRSARKDYPYVDNKDQAAQLAAYDIADSREGVTGTIPMKPYMRDLDPGDCFTMTEPDFSMSGQQFLVLSRSFNPQTNVVEVTVRSETSAKHAWALGRTGTAPASPTLGTTDPMSTPTPSGADWSLAAGGGETPSVVITGAVPSTVSVSRVVIEYRVHGTSAWLPWTEAPPTATTFEITGLYAATDYDVAVSYQNLFGVLGSRLTLGPATTAGNMATEVSPTTELVSGTGATALRIKDGRLWVGEGGVENANAVLDANGLLQRINDPTINVGGLAYLDANGLTPAALQQIASEFRTAAPATRVVQALAAHASSSGAIASWLTGTLMAASDVQLDVSFSLLGLSTLLSDFPASLTVTLYEQYSTDGGATWSTLTAVAGGTKTLSRITSGVPTSSQYLVTQDSFQEHDGSDWLTISYYRVEAPSALTFTVAAAPKAEAIYRWGLVGPTGALWLSPASTITATDTDDKASFLVGDLSIGASTPWANPVGHSSELVITRTGTATCQVTAAAITISSQSGSVRTVRNVNQTLNCATTGAGGLDTGSLAANTHYAIYMISDGTAGGDKLLASTSFTSPVMPAGYSYVGRIGAFYAGAGAEIHNFIKKGPRVRYIQTGTIALATLKTGSHGNISTPQWIGTSYVASTVPAVATDVLLSVYTTGATVMLAPNNSYGDESNSTNPPYMMIKTGGPTESHLVEIPNEDGNLYSASNNTNLRIRVAGYIDSV